MVWLRWPGIAVLSWGLAAGCSGSVSDGPRPPPRGPSTISVSFTGTVDPLTGTVRLGSVGPGADPVAASRAVTVVPVVQDGVAGSGPTDTIELVTESTATLSDGCGTGAAAFQGAVRLRSFHAGAVLRNVHAELTQLSSIGHEACNSVPVPALPPPLPGTISNTMGLFSYGTIATSLTAGNDALAAWRFRLPDSTPFTFRGRVIGDVVPVCDGTIGLPGRASVPAGASGRLWHLDMNGDGLRDVVVRTSTGVNVVLAGPGGTYAAPVAWNTTFTSLGGVAVGDLNKDGRPDLAFGGSYANYGVEVRLNDGDGSFAAGVTTAASGGLGDTAIADFNGDGWGDVVAAVGTSRGLAYFQNSGTGTFPRERTLSAGDSSALPTRVIVGDLTGDGRPEVVSLNSHLVQGSSLSVYPNNFGNLAGGTQYSNSAYGGTIPFAVPSAAALLDFSGDGKTDLVLVNGSDLLLVRGDGTVGGLSYVDYLRDTSGIHSPAVADLDGDGILDLAVPNQTAGKIWLLRGTGTALANWKTVSAGTPAGMTALDVDGDADVDLVVSSGGYVNTLENSGAGLFDAAETVWPVGAIFTAADLNRDGRVDVVGSGVRLGFGAGDGTFSTPYTYAISDASAATAADLDCDERTDVLFGTSGGSVRGLFGPASGTYFATQTLFTGTSAAKGIASADLNGDGRTDLVVANSDGTASIFLSNCTRTPPRTTVTIPTTTVAIALRDLGGDGITDLVLLSTGSPGFVGAMAGVGDGTFAARLDTALHAGATSPNTLALADVDHDGDLDAVTANGGTNDVTVLYGDGGAFTTSATFGTGKAVTGVAVADVSADGMPDLVAVHDTDNLLSVLVTPPSGTGAPALRQWMASRPARPVLADVNGDGWDDVLVRSATTGGTLLLRSRCLASP